MSKTHHSHCEYHLGDNLIHVHFLRKLAAMYRDHEFIHHVESQHVNQLRELIDVPNVEVESMDHLYHPGRNVWKNADGFWENHIYRNSWSNFYIEWFNKLAREMGMASPIQRSEDLLFDHPALLKNNEFSKPWDFLIVNSQPCSGQFMAYDSAQYMDGFVRQLHEAGHKILTTQPTAIQGVQCTQCIQGQQAPEYSLSVSAIGQAALWAKHLIMVSTGPSWACMNAYRPRNKGETIVLLEKERLDLPGIIQMANIEEIRDFARLRNWI